MCMECAPKVKKEFGRCPICKYLIKDIIQNYDWIYFIKYLTKFLNFINQLNEYIYWR